MTRELEVLFLPFLACLILTGIHAYLGIHVLSRKVIFVDIALAQIAALGATVGYLLGYDPRSGGAYWFSLGFAVIAAAIFALTRTRVERVPQEAIIGLTYAVASAAAILLADISPHGAEHLRDLLAGSIVWVTPQQVTKTAILYAVIGLFHFAFRKTFLLISMSPEEAYARGIRVRFWDFLFYLSFGVVITSSVQIAGVLLVFCYLVAPAVFAVMFSDTLRGRLALGWTLGVVISVLGLLFSYDRPSGPTIMVCFAAALLIGGLARTIMTSVNRLRAAVVAAATIALGLLAIYALLDVTAKPAMVNQDHAGGEAHGLGDTDHRDEPEPAPGLGSADPSARVEAITRLAESDPGAAAQEIVGALGDTSSLVREHAARTLGSLGDPRAIEPLRSLMTRPGEDEWIRLHAAESVARLGDASGIPVLLEISRQGDARMARMQALRTALELSGLPLAAGSDPDATEVRALGAALESWWDRHGDSVTWDPETRSFSPAADLGDLAP